MASNYPLAYQQQNANLTKTLNVVVEIEGSPYLFATLPTYKTPRYGDPGLTYGMAGLYYGGLVALDNVKPYLSINSNFTISQRIEPEQGRGSVSTLSLEFVDVAGFMSNFISRGQVLDDILGGKAVKVWLGYQNTSFKEDYFVIFRGYVSMTTVSATKVTLQLSDANLKKRSQIFYTPKTTVSNVTQPVSTITPLTDTLTIAGSKFRNGNKIQFTTTGGFPAGISGATDYYVINQSGDNFQISTDLDGTPVDIITTGTGTLSATMFNLGPHATFVPLTNAAGFTQPILGPDNTYDPSFLNFIRIGDELMSVAQGNLTSTGAIVTRGAENTVASDHGVGDDVANVIGLQGNVLDLALKVMLSGWNGDWMSGVAIKAFGQTFDPLYGIQPNAITLNDGVNAVEDLGLAVGDYLTVSGDGIGGNNTQAIVTGFISANGFLNNVIVTDTTFTPELTPTGTFSIRSQYDTLPINCGTKLRPTDVDVATFQYIRTQFVFHNYDVFRILIATPQSGKTFIESQFMLPVSAYSITRFGRISVAYTKPPIAGENLVILDKSNVKEPQNIEVTRGLNNRRYFNEIQYYYDFDVIRSTYANVFSKLDSDSLSINDVSSVLPIKADGLKSNLGAGEFVEAHSNYFINRYKNAAYEVKLKTTWEAASLIEVSDVVALYDNGDLQITNLDTGERDLGSQLFEVIQRELDIKSGQGSLTLLSSLGYQITDRFAGIAPSSLITDGSTTTVLKIIDSFGAIYPGNEKKKWEPIIGDQIEVHSPDYSFREVVTLVGFDPAQPYNMAVTPPLSVAPPAGYIIDLAPYDETSPNINQKSKLLFTYITASIAVVSGISNTQFTVSGGDAAKISTGQPIQLHNSSYSSQSPEVTVTDITGTTVTVSSDLGFTPDNTYIAEFIGFLDQGGPYRIL